MPTALQLIYQYRQLAGKCEPGGTGLSLDEIDRLSALGALFVNVPIDLPAQLRGRGAADLVQVVDLGRGGVVCKGAPYLDEGERVELSIDDEQRLHSYRFKAEVVWLRDDDADGFELGLRFIGVPLLLRYRGQRGPAVARAA